jgi:hypothetical protein
VWRDSNILGQSKEQSMSKLMRFAASQKNVDWVATWLGGGVAGLGVLLAVAIIVVMIVR